MRKIKISPFTLHLSDHQQRTICKKLDSAAAQDLLSNTWRCSDKTSSWGILSDRRISGELLQQELNSMLPVSIFAAITMTNLMLVIRTYYNIYPLPWSESCSRFKVLSTTKNNSQVMGIIEAMTQQIYRCSQWACATTSISNPNTMFLSGQ